MNEKFLHFTKHTVSFGDFHLKARDAYDTYNNIKLFLKITLDGSDLLNLFI